jgi:hypothetical protein
MKPATISLFECVLNQDALGVARAISQKAALDEWCGMHIVKNTDGSERLCNCEDDDHDFEEGSHINGRSPLLFAAMIGNVEIADLLICAGADVDNFDSYGMSPLHYAARRYQYSPNMVHLLVNCGAEIDQCDGDGFTPMCYLEMSVKAAINEASSFLEMMKLKSKSSKVTAGAVT